MAAPASRRGVGEPVGETAGESRAVSGKGGRRDLTTHLRSLAKLALAFLVARVLVGVVILRVEAGRGAAAG